MPCRPLSSSRRPPSDAYLTAHYALVHWHGCGGGIVLIHAGTGGWVRPRSRSPGASGWSFATAGTTEKRAQSLAAGVRHVMNSRTLEFADEVMELTAGAAWTRSSTRLSGDFIPKSFAALAPFGGSWRSARSTLQYPGSAWRRSRTTSRTSSSTWCRSPTGRGRPGQDLRRVERAVRGGPLPPAAAHRLPGREAVEAFPTWPGQARREDVLSSPAGKPGPAPCGAGPPVPRRRHLPDHGRRRGGSGWSWRKWLGGTGRGTSSVSRGGPATIGPAGRRAVARRRGDRAGRPRDVDPGRRRGRRRRAHPR